MEERRFNCGEINTDGYDYQLYTLLICIDRLRKNTNVREYDVSNAEVKFGTLDDVVFNVTLASGEKITTAIQVKHSSTNKMINERYLCYDVKTYLHKYFESFMDIKKHTSLEQLKQLIFWTNMTIDENVCHWFEEFDPNSNEGDILGGGSDGSISYKRYRIKCDKRVEIIQIYQELFRKDNRKGALQAKKRKLNHEASHAEWEQFFDRFVFYVNVPNVTQLKAYLMRNIEYFEDLCKLVENLAIKSIVTGDQINGLYTLTKLKNSMETGPYASLIFTDLDQLQCEVEKLFNNETCNVLRVKASQDVDCTVARLITVVEKCLAPESKRYLVFSYKTVILKLSEFKLILNDLKLIDIGSKCFIISSISDDEINKIESDHQFLCETEIHLSGLKVIFVGSNLKTDCDDKFDTNCLDEQQKGMIKSRIVRLSQWQNATVNAIFGKELFQKENYSMVLELYRLPKNSVLKITVNDPPLDIHYRPRTAKLSNARNISTYLNLLTQTYFHKLIIYDQPGMGKTTEMVKLCSLFREKYRDYLVVYLHCRSAVSKWRGSIEDLICNTVACCSKLTIHLVKKIIQLGKIVLIMDGYDEVSSKYNDKLKLLISEASCIKTVKFYIATRPQCKDEIANILKECGHCHLEPFSKDDQLEYLKKFWNINNSIQGKIDEKARCIIDHFRSIMDDSLLIGIPLQTHMIAVIYKDRILCPDFEVSGSHKLGFMFKEFVELKFQECVNRNFDPTNAIHAQAIKSLRENFLHVHIVAARKMYQNESDPEMEMVCEQIQHYGIVITVPVVQFIHFSYLEYFLALYFLTYSTEIKSMENFLKNFLFNADSLVFRFMDDLLDYIDPTEKPNGSLRESLYTHDVSIPLNYIPPKSARLHRDKMIEFNAALHNMDARNISNIFSYRMHLRQFNMFEVIYDSLREEVISEMRLCLDSCCAINHREINCLRLIASKNVDDLILILNILLKKYPNSFVTMYITSLGNQAQLLLELVCYRGFSKLFEWFVESYSELNEEQRKEFISFVERQWNRFFLAIIENNNGKLLQKVSTWIKNSWTKEATCSFLTNNNISRTLFENITVPNYYRINELIDPKIIELVKNVFDLYHWAFDEQPQLGGVFFDAIKLFQITSIKSVLMAYLLPVLDNIVERNPNTFFKMFLSSGDVQECLLYLLDLMCDPDYSILFDWLKAMIPKLNEEQRMGYTKILEEHLERCLLRIITYDNVELLKKIIIWVKTTWTKESTHQLLTKKNLLYFFTENIENGLEKSVVSKRIAMVQTVSDFYRWEFNGQIPVDSNLLSKIEKVQDSSIKREYAINFLPVLENLLKDCPTKLFTMHLTPVDDREVPLLELVCDPAFSIFFECLIEILQHLEEKQHNDLKRFVESRLDGYILKIIQKDNVELLENVIIWSKNTWTIEAIKRFLIRKNLLSVFAEKITIGVENPIVSRRIKMMTFCFDLHDWAFDGQIPLSNDLVSAMKCISCSSIGSAFKTNILSILKSFLKKNPKAFVMLCFNSVVDHELPLLDLMCDLDCLKLFYSLLEIFLKLDEEQSADIKSFIERELNSCLLKIINLNNVDLLKKVISWVKITWTASTINQFLTKKKLPRFFTENIENEDTFIISIRKEMVQVFSNLYRSQIDEQTPLESNFFILLQNLQHSAIKREFGKTCLFILKNNMKNNHNVFFTAYLAPTGDEELSLIELMWDPTFSKLFELLKEIVQKLNEEQCETLQGFVEKRLDRCIQKIMKYKNIRLLKKVIIWVRKSFEKETICQVLTKKRLLELFSKNITYELQKRVRLKTSKILQTVFDLYCWAFDGQMPLSIEFFDAIKFIKTNTMKNEFALKILPLLRNLFKNDPNRFVAIYSSSFNVSETTLLELMCESCDLDFIECLKVIFPKLNEAQRLALERFVKM